MRKAPDGSLSHFNSLALPYYHTVKIFTQNQTWLNTII